VFDPISPVFRDAFQMELLSKTLESSATTSEGKRVPVEQTDEGKIRIEANALAIRWFFGLLEGVKPIDFGISDKDDLTGPPAVAPIIEAMELSDKYDVTFYPGLLTAVLMVMARTSKHHAVTVYAIAYHMQHTALAQHAIVCMAGLQDPATWDLHTANLISLQPWWSLCAAFRAVSVETSGTNASKWKLVSEELTLYRLVSACTETRVGRVRLNFPACSKNLFHQQSQIHGDRKGLAIHEDLPKYMFMPNPPSKLPTESSLAVHSCITVTHMQNSLRTYFSFLERLWFTLNIFVLRRQPYRPELILVGATPTATPEI
jgi:hypothetical protein